MSRWGLDLFASAVSRRCLHWLGNLLQQLPRRAPPHSDEGSADYMQLQKIPAVHTGNPVCLTSESLHFVQIYDQKLPGPSASDGRRSPDQGKKRFEGKGRKSRRNNMPMIWFLVFFIYTL